MSAGALRAGLSARAGPGASGPGATRLAGPGWRVVLLIARAEALRLARNPLVLAGILVTLAAVWWNNTRQVPLWWGADVGIGSALLAMAGGVLVAAHLAASRAKRDGMQELYESCPAPAAARAGGVLACLVGPAVMAAAVSGAALLWLDRLGAVGSPRPAVLVGGWLLVVLGGAVGVALGTWLPHPLVGILAAVVLGLVETDIVLAFNGWVQFQGPDIWLFPWADNSFVLGSLPGGVVPIPPAWAHDAELTGLVGLCVVATLWRALPGGPRRAIPRGSRRMPRSARVRWLAASAAACLAVTAWSGWAQDRPVP
ncbi:MAG TPA: hypothetical protein VGS19_01795, partial [Streptosporangiaceae bacterium]|nr:hypothetical protein [Streptosporangiaceae bacterium]